MTIILPGFLATQETAIASYGTDFYIGLMINFNTTTENIWLFITTPFSSPVNYTIADFTHIISAGIVTNVSPVNESIDISYVTLNSSYSQRKKGIHVYTENGGLISVLVINYVYYSSGDYLAYSHQELLIHQYRYFVVSIVTAELLSGVLLVGNKDKTTVTIIPTQSIVVPQDIQNSTSAEMTVTAGAPFTITLHKMQTFLFGSLTADISGTSIVSDKPLTVISGHECAYIPINVTACEQLTEQIPPTVTWGKRFLLTPYAGRSRRYYKIIAADNKTTLTYRCSTDSAVTLYLLNPGDFTTFYSNTSYCSLVSDKPVLVTQLGPGNNFDFLGIGDPVISTIPPIDQYFENVTFISPILPIIETHHLNLASTANDTVLMDGEPLSLTWNNIYDSDNNIIGYGAQIPITDLTSHTITTQSNTKFSALVYGFGWSTGYSYSANVNQMQLVQSR